MVLVLNLESEIAILFTLRDGGCTGNGHTVLISAADSLRELVGGCTTVGIYNFSQPEHKLVLISHMDISNKRMLQGLVVVVTLFNKVSKCMFVLTDARLSWHPGVLQPTHATLGG